MPRLSRITDTFKMQTEEVFSEAAPVVGTYYTMLDTKYDVKVLAIGIKVTTNNATLQIRITVDGVVISTPAMVCAVDAWKVIAVVPSASTSLYLGTSGGAGVVPLMFEGHSVKIEVVKLAEDGAGALSGIVTYEKK